MISIFDSVQWHTTPTMNWTIKYEYQRNGADMQYRFYWKVWVAYNDGWYDYALNLQLFLDGTRHDVKIKDVVTGNYGWSYEGTTDWYTVKNKTTGTTSFYASIYNVNTASIKATSSTSGLTVSGAASVLGTIADFNLGDGIKIPITKYDSSFVDTLIIYYGERTVKKITGIANGDAVSLTDDELSVVYRDMSTVKSGTFTFTLYTMANSTLLGTNTRTATGTIVNANPTFTESQVTYEDINSAVYAITGNPQHIVQNKSSLRVNYTNATANKGATISHYTITVNGVTKKGFGISNPSSIDFGAVNTSQNTKITVVVTDSRGNTTTVTKNVTILAYSTPIFTVDLERLNNYEDETYLTVKATIATVNSKNAVTITYKKKQSGGTYGTETTLTNNAKHTTSCDKDLSYVFSITVADKFETVTLEYVLPNGKFPLFIDTEKNAVGVNEFPSEGEALRVSGGVACFDEGIVLKTESKSFKITINDSGVLVITEMKGETQ